MTGLRAAPTPRSRGGAPGQCSVPITKTYAVADPAERPADHVGRDEQRDPVERDGRMLDEVARAEEADLLEVEADEHDAPLAAVRGASTSEPGDLEHHGDARGVVVGARVERLRRGRPGGRNGPRR